MPEHTPLFLRPDPAPTLHLPCHCAGKGTAAYEAKRDPESRWRSYYTCLECGYEKGGRGPLYPEA